MPNEVWEPQITQRELKQLLKLLRKYMHEMHRQKEGAIVQVVGVVHSWVEGDLE